jgi:hypothetical protein
VRPSAAEVDLMLEAALTGLLVFCPEEPVEPPEEPPVEPPVEPPEEPPVEPPVEPPDEPPELPPLLPPAEPVFWAPLLEPVPVAPVPGGGLTPAGGIPGVMLLGALAAAFLKASTVLSPVEALRREC